MSYGVLMPHLQDEDDADGREHRDQVVRAVAVRLLEGLQQAEEREEDDDELLPRPAVLRVDAAQVGDVDHLSGRCTKLR